LSGFDESGSLTWYIRAEDVSGLKDSTNVNALTIAIPPEEPEDLSIADLLADLSNYVGEIVEIDGVVTVSAGKLRTSFTEAFLQDESGKGIILYNSSLDTSFHRGDSVMVTAEVDEFDGRPELIYSDIQILMENVELPTVEISIAEFNTLEYSYTFVKLWGKITSRSNPSGTNTGANIDIQDETGEVTTMRIWNTTNVLYNEDFELINLELDSLLQVGNEIEVLGIGGDYNGASQVQPAYAEDISEKQEGEVGDYSITLEVSPFPFVPQFGEVINYTYSFPDDARIKLRVFDVSGRHITTLFDEFRSISFYKESEWDGRNELNEIVGPGVYLMYLEVTDRSSGNTSTAVAPVVIGARMQ
jgi:DNA/RNA endonuclease YhcR with UshA esterase domain